jgi:hypothetical protein
VRDAVTLCGKDRVRIGDRADDTCRRNSYVGCVKAKAILLPCAVAVAANATPATAADWSSPRPLVKDRSASPVSLHLAVDDAGNGAFVWTSGKSIRARMRTPGGRLGAVTTLHRGRYGVMGLPQIALGPGGRAVRQRSRCRRTVPGSSRRASRLRTRTLGPPR